MWDLLKNETVQTIILIAIIIAVVATFWFGLRFALRTDYPLLAVASGSMVPTLYEGDLIIVQGISNFSELHVGVYKLPNRTLNPNPGEAIVFYDPRSGRIPVYLPVAGPGARLIVHRAISKVENNDGTWYFQTQGDNNTSPDRWSGPDTLDGRISENLMVGKVVGKVPWLGHIPLFMHENRISATIVIILLFVVLIVVDFVFPKKRKEKQKVDKESC